MITSTHAFFNWAILRKWLRPWWVVAGSVLPDTPPFVAFFYLLAEKGLNPPGTGGREVLDSPRTTSGTPHPNQVWGRSPSRSPGGWLLSLPDVQEDFVLMESGC